MPTIIDFRRPACAATGLAAIAIVACVAGVGLRQSPSWAQADVPQRAVLYEEDPADRHGKRYVGSARWRTESISVPGQSPELGVRADIEVPERKLAMSWALRRNTDRALPASHTIEIMFRLPGDFPGGGIADVPGVLMKRTEQARGASLAGLTVRVTDDFFMIGLSQLETDMKRNVAMLKEHAWFDLPFVYKDNRRAILTMEKGAPGERAFTETLKLWGQPGWAQADVGQRAVLYEEDPAERYGKRYAGSARWRTESISVPGQSPELGVRADIEVPERKLSMTWVLRRNTDRTLPASHTIEIMLRLPGDFPGGGIADVPGILMKQYEQARGSPLAGLPVKVTDGFFMIGLSQLETDMKRNVAMLKEQAWFDLAFVYKDNRRAILAMEKGAPGERAFAEAFKVWNQ